MLDTEHRVRHSGGDADAARRRRAIDLVALLWVGQTAATSTVLGRYGDAAAAGSTLAWYALAALYAVLAALSERDATRPALGPLPAAALAAFGAVACAAAAGLPGALGAAGAPVGPPDWVVLALCFGLRALGTGPAARH